MSCIGLKKTLLACLLCLALLLCVGRCDDSCPPATALAPCTCDGEGVNCMAARSLQDIKRAFRANFKYGGVRAVWVQGTPITTLPADTFGGVRSQQFYVEVNNLTSVDIGAFNASKDILHTLSLFGNKLTKFPFGAISAFNNLITLNLGRNLLDTIPDGAFNHRALNALILTQNKIQHIGMNAFANLPNLVRLELGTNQLKTLGPLSLAFKAHQPSLQINLSINQISSVSSSAFNGADPYVVFFSRNQLQELKFDVFGTLATKILNKQGFLEVSGNPFTCRGCEYSWLVLNKQPLSSRLIGFLCTDGRQLQQLTRQNIGC